MSIKEFKGDKEFIDHVSLLMSNAIPALMTEQGLSQRDAELVIFGASMQLVEGRYKTECASKKKLRELMKKAIAAYKKEGRK